MVVGICGGIGSGKSTVCDIFKGLGIPVYISDDKAKEVMDSSEELKQKIRETFGEECIVEGAVMRKTLASKAFSSQENIQKLNSIVHPAVRKDFLAWAALQDAPYVILESAILFDSGFDSLVDYSVAVLAPASLRIQRAMQRDGATEAQIKERIARQMPDDELVRRASFSIVNFSLEDVEKDVKELDFRFRHREQ